MLFSTPQPRNDIDDADPIPFSDNNDATSLNQLNAGVPRLDFDLTPVADTGR